MPKVTTKTVSDGYELSEAAQAARWAGFNGEELNNLSNYYKTVDGNQGPRRVERLLKAAHLLHETVEAKIVSTLDRALKVLRSEEDEEDGD